MFERQEFFLVRYPVYPTSHYVKDKETKAKSQAYTTSPFFGVSGVEASYEVEFAGAGAFGLR